MLSIWESKLWGKYFQVRFTSHMPGRKISCPIKLKSCIKSWLFCEILGEGAAVWWEEGWNWRRGRFLLFLPDRCLHSSQDILSRSFVISRVQGIYYSSDVLISVIYRSQVQFCRALENKIFLLFAVEFFLNELSCDEHRMLVQTVVWFPSVAC